MQIKDHLKILLLSAIISFSLFKVFAQDTSQTEFDFHFQTTYIYQYCSAFKAKYSGTNSLSNLEQKQNSLTSTLYFGAKLWKGGSFYINPEIAGGSGLSGALGMGGSSNGETFRVGNPAPTLYLARGFLQQFIALGTETELQPEEENMIKQMVPKNYVKINFGKLSLADLIDMNDYANSPRTQFLNWGLMNNGAWDFAANVRGYTLALSTEINYKKNNFIIALAELPKVANGAILNPKINQSFSLNAQFSRDFSIKKNKGKYLILGYLNKAKMGNYKEALALSPTLPDFTPTRNKEAITFGFGFNLQFDLNKNLSIFNRLGWNNGQYETWCFTEIDRTASLGLSLSGKAFKRNDDVTGIALLINALSKNHQQYLKNGGQGFILGDGNLNYSPETIIELFYNYKIKSQPLWFTVDYQYALHPGYNLDRGNPSILSLRLHTQI